MGGTTGYVRDVWSRPGRYAFAEPTASPCWSRDREPASRRRVSLGEAPQYVQERVGEGTHLGAVTHSSTACSPPPPGPRRRLGSTVATRLFVSLLWTELGLGCAPWASHGLWSPDQQRVQLLRTHPPRAHVTGDRRPRHPRPRGE